MASFAIGCSVDAVTHELLFHTGAVALAAVGGVVLGRFAAARRGPTTVASGTAG